MRWSGGAGPASAAAGRCRRFGIRVWRGCKVLRLGTSLRGKSRGGVVTETTRRPRRGSVKHGWVIGGIDDVGVVGRGDDGTSELSCRVSKETDDHPAGDAVELGSRLVRDEDARVACHCAGRFLPRVRLLHRASPASATDLDWGPVEELARTQHGSDCGKHYQVVDVVDAGHSRSNAGSASGARSCAGGCCASRRTAPPSVAASSAQIAPPTNA